LVIADILEDACRETAREVADKYGVEAIAITCDVSNEPQVKAMIEQTVKRLGRLDILVNNAGIYPYKPLLDITVEDWDKMQAVNMRGVFLCTREAAKAMKEGSKIINISSAASVVGWLWLAHYSASKGGVNAYTRSAALELAPRRINVNAVAPGGVHRDPSVPLSEEAKALVERVPLKRFGTPEDIGHAVVFLASEKADYITGQVLLVDGGYTAQ
jgi:NAD(P)-dependent dehydrogenase (short-subunit alcohol dehydrogenase family)